MLFESVHLNVNNPHFLIMQGRITKILNMKPQEITILLEETAGTRMYEERKERALVTMGKKEKQVEDITNLLNENILPRLDGLRKQRKDLLEQQVLARDTEVAEQRYIIAEYALVRQEWSMRVEKQKMFDSEISVLKKEVIPALLKKKDFVQKKIDMLRKKQSRSIHLTGLEGKRSCLVKDIIREETRQQGVEESLDETNYKIETIKSELKEPVFCFSDVDEEYSRKKSEIEEAQSEMEVLRRLLGLFSGSGKKIDACEFENAVESENLVQSRLKSELDICEKRYGALMEIVSKQGARKGEWELYLEGLVGQREDLRSEMLRVRNEISLLEAGGGGDVQRERAVLEKETFSKKQMMMGLENQIGALRNDDYLESGVRCYGSIGSLIYLKPEVREWALALETCAGGRLFNLVVDTEKEASELMPHLKRRTTVLPLNKIEGRYISRDKLKLIREIAGMSDAVEALDLIVYDEKYLNAMRHVFGGVILCSTKQIASSIAFNSSIGVRCITIEGDVYDPAGTMSGGYVKKACEILSSSSQFEDMRRELDVLSSKFGVLSDKMARCMSLENELASLVASEKIIGDKILNDDMCRSLEILNRSMKEIVDLEVERKKIEESLERSNGRLGMYLGEMKSKGAGVEDREKSLRQRIAGLEKEFVVVSEKKHACDLRRESERASRDVLETELNILLERQKSMKSELGNVSRDVGVFRDELIQIEAELGKEKSDLSMELQELEMLGDEFEMCVSELKDYECALDSSLMSQNQLKDEMVKKHGEVESLKRRVAEFGAVMEENEMMVDEIDGLFVSGLRKVFLEKKARLERKTMGGSGDSSSLVEMIDSLERQETELLGHLGQVREDKRKIEDTICNLNVFKRDALKTTFDKVNKDFGEIFSMLLPGSNARLETEDVSHGVELGVCLAGVWRKSLGELSGGQR